MLCKHLNLRGVLGNMLAKGVGLRGFPCIFPVNRENTGETSPIQTVCTAKQSGLCGWYSQL